MSHRQFVEEEVMERNANETPTNHTPGQGNATGSGSAPLSGTGYGASAGSSSTGSSASGSASGSSSQGGMSGGLADRAKNVASGAREKVAGAKDALADRLEAGADVVRQRAQGGSLAGAGEGAATLEGDNRLAALGGSLATGMKGTADWLREADLESMKASVEQQVKEHPGRTLLIALGVGYLLGKAFRR